MHTGTDVAPKKRGRPSKGMRTSLVAPPSPRKDSVVEPYVTFLKANPQAPEPKGYSLELFVKRFAEATADYSDSTLLEQKFADAAGISQHVASRVFAGLTPLTAKMVAATAKHLGMSSDDLLVGRTHHPIPATLHPGNLSEDEALLLKAYEAASGIRKACMLFTVSLQRLLETLPPAGRDRVIASLAALHDAGAQVELAFLPQLLGAYQVRTGNDPADCFDAAPIFTPWHEILGVFGPEQTPLWKYLEG